MNSLVVNWFLNFWFRRANEEYTKHVKMLSEKIMEWLSEGLGLWGEAIKEVIGGEYMMIVNYYPPCPHSDLIEGLDPHTDVSGLTLILPNEIPGLQVFKDDHWFDLENIPSAVIVIIGDQILVCFHLMCLYHKLSFFFKNYL